MASDSKNCEKTHVFASSLSRNNTKLQPKWATACATHTHTHTIQISRVMNVPAVVRKLARIHAVLMSSHQINCYLCGVCVFARVVVCFDYFMRYEYDDSNWKPQDVRRFLATSNVLSLLLLLLLGVMQCEAMRIKRTWRTRWTRNIICGRHGKCQHKIHVIDI